MGETAGWRLRSVIVDAGLFHCPIDGGDRFYDLTDVRRWFTVFGLPVVPGRRLGRYVICVGCGSSYTEEVLAIPTAAEMLERFEAASLTLMRELYRRTGDDARCRAAILKSARKVIAPERSLIDVMTGETLTVDEFAKTLTKAAEFMDLLGRQRLISVAIGAVTRDLRIGDGHQELLELAGTALLLPPATVRKLITTAAPLT